MASTSGVTHKPTIKTQEKVLLKIERVSKLFDDVRAVDDVS
ncbi:MAG: polyamine ABC transporter ATP-binding protein, partial [Shewanella sp.]